MASVTEHNYQPVGCCKNCAKGDTCCGLCGNPCWSIFLIVINAVVMIFGFSLLAVTGYRWWTRSNSLLDGLYVASFVLATVITIISLLGLIGSCLERVSMRKSGKVACSFVVYYVLVLLLFLALFIAAVAALALAGYANDVPNVVATADKGKNQIDYWAQVYAGSNPNNWIQYQTFFECCGYANKTDYLATGPYCGSVGSSLADTPTCRDDFFADVKAKSRTIGAVGITLAILMILVLIAGDCVMCCLKVEVEDKEEIELRSTDGDGIIDVSKATATEHDKVFKDHCCRKFLCGWNILAFVFGVILLALAAWLLYKYAPSRELLGVQVFLALVIMAISLMGAIGANNAKTPGKGSCCLVVYYVLLFFFFVVQIIVAAFILTVVTEARYAYSAKITEIGTTQLDKTFVAIARAAPDAWKNDFQNNLDCCGYTNATSLADLKTGNYCNVTTYPVTEYCRDSLIDLAWKQGRVVGGFGVGTIFVTFILVVSASYVLCCMKKEGEGKPDDGCC